MLVYLARRRSGAARARGRRTGRRRGRRRSAAWLADPYNKVNLVSAPLWGICEEGLRPWRNDVAGFQFWCEILDHNCSYVKITDPGIELCTPCANYASTFGLFLPLVFKSCSGSDREAHLHTIQKGGPDHVQLQQIGEQMSAKHMHLQRREGGAPHQQEHRLCFPTII